MCGIIGYVGPTGVQGSLLLHGLERLEYRGYDSAGIALLEEDGLVYTRAVGNLQNLKREAGEGRLAGDHGTRSHPLGDARRRHARRTRIHSPATIRRRSRSCSTGSSRTTASCASGCARRATTFTSETDAETVTHLIEEHYDGDLVEATRLAFNELEGHFAFVVIHRDHPGLLVGARHAVPARRRRRARRDVPRLERGGVPARDARGALPRGRRHRGDHGRRSPHSCAPRTAAPIERELVELDWDDESAEKARLRDVHAEGDLRAARGRRRDDRRPRASRPARARGARHGRRATSTVLRRIVILSAGTSYHAAVAGRYAIEEWARVPVEHDIASEWIYRNPVLDASTLVIGISQSGETRDTIAAMKLAREMGAQHGRDHEHDGLADHPRGRLGPLHARRARGQRRGVEDVHGAGERCSSSWR